MLYHIKQKMYYYRSVSIIGNLINIMFSYAGLVFSVTTTALHHLTSAHSLQHCSVHGLVNRVSHFHRILSNNRNAVYRKNSLQSENGYHSDLNTHMRSSRKQTLQNRKCLFLILTCFIWFLGCNFKITQNEITSSPSISYLHGYSKS